MLLIRGNVTRMALIKLLVSMDTGEHVNIPGVDLFPVTAVKISVAINTSIQFLCPVLQSLGIFLCRLTLACQAPSVCCGEPKKATGSLCKFRVTQWIINCIFFSRTRIICHHSWLWMVSFYPPVTYSSKCFPGLPGSWSNNKYICLAFERQRYL